MKSDAFSQIIRKRRTALAISPVQLARKAGVNMAVVGALEGGDVRHVNVAELLKVMHSLGLQLSESEAVDAKPPAPQDQPLVEEAPKPIPANLKIRLATLDDASAISELIAPLAPAFFAQANGQGAEAFLQSITPEGIAAVLADPQYRYHTGWIGDTLAGVLAMKGGHHVFHWFVRPDMQRRGLGRKLWVQVKAQAIASGQRGTFTVNAAVDAVPAYERLGFDVTGEVQEQGGLRFVPMELG
jgi:GNAT superfamily N-acetyltransferase